MNKNQDMLLNEIKDVLVTIAGEKPAFGHYDIEEIEVATKIVLEDKAQKRHEDMAKWSWQV